MEEDLWKYFFGNFRKEIWKIAGGAFGDFEFVEGLVDEDKKGEDKKGEEFELVEGLQTQGAQDAAPNPAASRAQAQTLTQQ